MHSTIQTVLAFAPPSQDGQGSPYSLFIMLGLMFLIFWLLVLRPQQKKQGEHRKMLESLSKGDRVVTNGGLHATVTNVKDGIVVATIADGVKVELSQSAIAARVKTKSSK